jgi:hypothetical protein
VSIGIIENKDLIPCTIGFFGDWGSGKSSLIRMVEDRYRGVDDVLTIKFNGWLFEGYDDAKSVLMKTILEHIVKNKTFTSKAKEIAIRLYKQIDWMRVAKSAVSHGAAYLLTGGIGNIALGMKDLISLDKEDVSTLTNNFEDGKYDELIENISKSKETNKTFQAGIREFHEDFEKLLEETNIKKLIVFIDDLDRCTPDTIISTLEAIKLFLFVPKSTFIICADERLIKYAVRKRFPQIQGSNAEVGRDYLEKLIQYPIRIAPMDNLEMETFINLLFCKLNLNPSDFEKVRGQVMGNKKKELFSSVLNAETAPNFFDSKKAPQKLIEDLMLSNQINQLLVVGLNGNPRQCKRFLNMLLLRLQMAESKGVQIKKQVLAKLMLLEYFKPETFGTISTIQAENEGLSKEIALAEKLIEDEREDISSESLKFEVNNLLDEFWFKSWFSIEPKLAKVDLRPYFYFSRDTLSAITIETSRMSSQAQEVFQKLISESKAIVKGGLSSFKTLSNAEAASVFAALGKKIKQIDDGVRTGEYLKTLLGLSEIKTELLSELMQFLDNLPINLITPATVPSLTKCAKGTPYENSAKELIRKWSKSDNKTLAGVANNVNN